jgi:hypothetical protein
VAKEAVADVVVAGQEVAAALVVEVHMAGVLHRHVEHHHTHRHIITHHMGAVWAMEDMDIAAQVRGLQCLHYCLITYTGYGWFTSRYYTSAPIYERPPFWITYIATSHVAYLNGRSRLYYFQDNTTLVVKVSCIFVFDAQLLHIGKCWYVQNRC